MEPKTELEELRDSVHRIETRMVDFSSRLHYLRKVTEEVATMLGELLAAAQEAVEYEEEPQSSQADVLAEAISKLASANDEDQKPKTAFPAWGAPRVEE